MHTDADIFVLPGEFIEFRFAFVLEEILNFNKRRKELYSQVALHQQFGGVIPEIASRTQLEKINTIVEHALKKAAISLSDIDTIAVTHKPGLPGSLLVGVCFSKAMAWATGKT